MHVAHVDVTAPEQRIQIRKQPRVLPPSTTARCPDVDPSARLRHDSGPAPAETEPSARTGDHSLPAQATGHAARAAWSVLLRTGVHSLCEHPEYWDEAKGASGV